MACSSSALLFTDGPNRNLYTTGLVGFQPRKLLTVDPTPGGRRDPHGAQIGQIRVAGPWAAFATYTQAGEQVSPLGAWSVYGVEISSGRAVKLASGSDPTQLSELPYPTAGDGFIVWDQLMSNGHKVLWRYDIGSGATTQVNLPVDMYPVYPAGFGHKSVVPGQQPRS